MTHLGERMVQLRKQHGWSQADLAEQAGVSREAIGKYERGEAQPPVQTAKQIADVFEVTLDWMLDGSASASLDPQVLQRLEKIQQLPPEERQHLYALMDAFLRDAHTRKAYAS